MDVPFFDQKMEAPCFDFDMGTNEHCDEGHEFGTVT